MEEGKSSEAHIYNVVDEGHAYEVVAMDSKGKSHQKKLPSSATGKIKNEFNLKPCPAYVPVTTQGTTQGSEAKEDTMYETVA